jgi:multiple sugar transport system permease protein
MGRLEGVAQRQKLGVRKLGLRFRRMRNLGNYLFIAPSLIFLAAIMIYPLAYTLVLSLRDVTIGNFLAGSGAFIGLENYHRVLATQEFRSALVITIIFTIGSLLFQHSIGFGLALFFNRQFPAAGTMRAIMLGAWLLPIVVSANVWRWMLDGGFGVFNFLLQGLGLLGEPRYWLTDPDTALIGTIIANIWVGIPFHMLLLSAGLQSISPSLYEAASIDGANAWQRVRHITIPLMRPVSLTVLLLGFIHTFRVFDLIFVMTAGGPAGATNVLGIQVYKLSFEFFRFGEGAAAANLLLVIPLILAGLYVWLRRKEEQY